ncbi:MAG: ABC transporter permease, partial [Halobacteriota archaeon]
MKFIQIASKGIREALRDRRAFVLRMKFIQIASKGIREALRDRRGFVFILGLPILLIVLFSFAFGSGTFLSGGSLPHEIVVVNNDVGVIVTANNTTQYVNYGTTFTGLLRNATVENGSTRLFQLNNVSQDKAQDLLKSRSIDALIIIPQNFSSAFTTTINDSTRTAITSSIGQQTIANAGFSPAGIYIPGANVNLPAAGNTTATLIIQGDPGFVNFATSQATVTEILDHYKNDVQANATAASAPGAGNSLLADHVLVATRSIAGTQAFSLFDYMVPGLIVFALLLQVSLVASSLAREAETGLLDRLKLSQVGAFNLLFGTFLTWTLITIGQVLLLVVIAIALGYHHQGNLGSLGLAVIIGAIAGMASISLALIVSSFAKNERQAISLGVMISTPLAFLAGAFFPLPRQVFG